MQQSGNGYNGSHRQGSAAAAPYIPRDPPTPKPPVVAAKPAAAAKPTGDDRKANMWQFMTKAELTKNSPSLKDGIDEKRQMYFRSSYCDFLKEAGMTLRLYAPQPPPRTPLRPPRLR